MAQKNTLQFIILGLLSQESMTGYELTQSFAHEIGEFWQAKHSQIYPLLNKMEDQQLISHVDEVTGTKLAKKRYSITQQGDDVLQEWIAEPTDFISSSKDEFILKLYFIKDKNDKRLTSMFNEQIRLHKEWLQHLKSRNEDLFNKRSQQNAQFGHYLILNHAIDREQNYVQWLETQFNNL
ncbi:PadR family transcriptional regulator [Paucilactobacillus suebicus]|uniref:Regulator of phenolic acid metabolism PadR n=1 Tax=Paucilactobacillus suebicus DSM 5007 = KCTC 3549 TaxID=1423807 RepID=A0A0R1W1P0_9LACO|nr:PadR family transcriptional regulator [Paucilactobacillus suebicus]KRM11439.1 regulator of phenolic acid metabolism PadR [Paucilactobacillus suebicus DSM 5007 = KCTC 3549]